MLDSRLMPLGPFVIVLASSEASRAFAEVVVAFLYRQAPPELIALANRAKLVQAHAEAVTAQLEALEKEIETDGE